MDDQALVEGSVVFKDEDDPAEGSQLAELQAHNSSFLPAVSDLA